jgi:hypothetical protein
MGSFSKLKHIHITTDSMDTLLQAFRDRAQKFDHAILLTVWQNCPDHQPPFHQPCRYNHHIVAVAFLECDFIQSNDPQGRILPPVHAGVGAPLQCSQNTITCHPFFDPHIFYARVHQLQQQVIILPLTLWTIALSPIQPLGWRWMILTLHTLVAPQTIAQVARSPEDWQVTDDRPLIIPLPLANLSPTPAAVCAFFRALDGDDQIAYFVDLCAQYPYMGYVQRYRYLCSFQLSILPPLMGGTTATPNEPKIVRFMQNHLLTKAALRLSSHPQPDIILSNFKSHSHDVDHTKWSLFSLSILCILLDPIRRRSDE